MRHQAEAGRPQVIAVAGNMGAGKSSLVEWLRQQFGMVPFFEPNDDNPYLEDFYADMGRWGYSSQLWFLIRRFHIHRSIDQRAAHDSTPIVQDRTIYEDAEIFAAHLHRSGRIDERDWASYQDLYLTLREELRPPDLMIYVRCPLKTLAKRIRKRGRDFERAVPRRYLAALEKLYDDWVEQYDASPTLVVETDRLDYIERLFDRLELLQAIERHAGVTPLRR
ncbi:MAG: deoxynucleoside kinase [Deltaproteobacteria bacterium]|nr:MAG: deoxynucleoside kinase [Deltaproteobacteria bacterium]